jgi:hypothetical protein
MFFYLYTFFFVCLFRLSHLQQQSLESEQRTIALNQAENDAQAGGCGC